INSSEDNLIFDFEKVLDIKDVRIDIEEKGENSEPAPEDIENNTECKYYENEEGNYISIWD
ncbi:13866_t:CDS:1, partial [Racocetra persica]